MNRKSIASVSADAGGEYWWTPTPKVAALGLRPVRLGKALAGFDAEKLGNLYDDDQELRTVVCNLNASARALARKDKADRKLAKQITDARSPDR